MKRFDWSSSLLRQFFARRSRRKRHLLLPVNAECLEKRQLLAADLAGHLFSVTNDHVQSGLVQIDLAVRNQGNDAAGAFSTNVLWSRNLVIGDADDVLVEASELSFSGLDIGEIESRHLDLQLDRNLLNDHAEASDPAGSAVGTMSTDVSYLFLVIDTQNAVTESNEQNNSGHQFLSDFEDISLFPWDYDGNGVVTPMDALATWRSVGTGDARADFDGNGQATMPEAEAVRQRIGYRWNSAPYVVQGQTIRSVDNFTPTAEVDLSRIITSVDDSALSWRISSVDVSAVDARIEDSTLVITGVDGRITQKQIIVEAETADGQTASATIDVDINRPLEPVRAEPIPDASVNEDAATLDIDLTSYFFLQRPGYQLTFAAATSAASLVTATINDSILSVDFQQDQHGTATITVTPTIEKGGETTALTALSFSVGVAAVNDAPLVVNPVTPVTVDEDSVTSTIDLSELFADPDTSTDGDTFTLSLGDTTPPGLLTATLDGTTLSLDYTADAFGTGSILIRATDSVGASETSTINVTVDAINDSPSLLSPMQDVSVRTAAAHHIINLLDVFTDAEEHDSLTYTVNSTTPGVVAAGLDDKFLTLVFSASEGGVSTITVTATDSEGLSVTDSMTATVEAYIDITGEEQLDVDTYALAAKGELLDRTSVAEGLASSEFVANEILISLKTDPASNIDSAAAYIEKRDFVLIDEFFDAGDSSIGESDLHYLLIAITDDVDLAATIVDLNTKKWVEFAEPNSTTQPAQHADCDAIRPDDRSYSQPSLTDIHLTEALEYLEVNFPNASSNRPVVAVIDTGVDYKHTDLDANIWNNVAERNGVPGKDDDNNGFIDDTFGWDFVGPTPNGYPYEYLCGREDLRTPDNKPGDIQGHGTHVAGTIGAERNGVGVDGVAPYVRIMPIRAGYATIPRASYLSPNASLQTGAIVKAIMYATRNGADIINASFAGYDSRFGRALLKPIQRAVKRDVIFVAAAGNESKTIDITPVYPAAVELRKNDLLISVGASTTGGFHAASFSNAGANNVDLFAPGTNINSTAPTHWESHGHYIKYQSLSGTSMAAPHVAGVAALLLSAIPTATGKEVKAAILASVDKHESLSSLSATGGRLNALNALVELERMVLGGGGSQLKAVNFAINTPSATSVSFNPLSRVDTTGGGIVRVTAAGNSLYGSLELDDAGIITYTPPSDFVGVDDLDYTIENDNGEASTGTVYINVLNAAPAAVADTAIIRTGSLIELQVTQNDSDADGDQFAIARFGQPAHGNVRRLDAQSEVLIYTPEDGYVGSDSFTYTIWDTYGAESQAQVTIDVRGFVAPANVAFSDVFRKSVSVSWTHADPLAGLTGFRVDVREVGSGNWQAAKDINGNSIDLLNTSDRATTVGELKQNTAHEVRIRSVYVESEPAIVSQVTTADFISATSLAVSEVGITHATVSWQHNDPSPGLDLFRIRTTTDDLTVVDPADANWTVRNENVNKDLRTKVVEGLDLAETYYVQVRAVYKTLDVNGEFIAADAEIGPFTTDDATISGLRKIEARRKQIDVAWDSVEAWANWTKVQWRKTGTSNWSGSGELLKSRTQYTISELNRGTDYEILLSAGRGNATRTASTFIETVDFVSPVALAVTDIGTTQATVSWKHTDSLAGLDSFRIRTTTDNLTIVDPADANWTVRNETVNKDLRIKTVEGLDLNETYYIQVRAVYETVEQNGTFSAADAEFGPFTTQDAGVSGVLTTAVRRKQIDVAWDSVEAWANWTKVQWRKSGTSNWSGSGELLKSRTQYTITELDKNTEYEIMVTAGRGNTTRFQTITRTTADYVKPGQPAFSNVTSSSITLTWSHNDPAGGADGFAILRNGSKIGEVGATQRTFTDNGASPATTYTYSIRAKYSLDNIDGDSASQSTPAAPPTQPQNLNTQVLSSTSIRLTWSDSQGETSNDVWMWNGSSWTKLSVEAANVTSYTANGLESGRTYWFLIRARNSAGTSDSAQASGRTNSGPINFRLATQSRSRIRMNWDDTNWENSYDVYQYRNSQWEKIASVGKNATQYDASGLNSNTTYYFAVKAVNAVESLWSSYTSTTTFSYVRPSGVTNPTQQRNQSFRIDWSFDEPNGGVQDFRIIRIKDDNSTKLLRKLDKGTTTFANRSAVINSSNSPINDFSPGKTFRVFVRVTYEDGTTLDSAAITVTMN